MPEKTMTSKIAKNILLISHEKNITQKELAASAGFSDEMLSQIMRGKKTMPIERLPMIAKSLGVSVDKLVK